MNAYKYILHYSSMYIHVNINPTLLPLQELIPGVFSMQIFPFRNPEAIAYYNTTSIAFLTFR